MVIATNAFTGFQSSIETIDIPPRYKKKPYYHESYAWISKDNTVTNIKDMDASHLRNVYKMLVRTILFAKEIAKTKPLSRHALKVVETCDYHLEHIGYELDIRQKQLQVKSV